MIEVLATGLGPNADLATFEALKRAVEQETRVMVESRILVENHRVVDDTIVTQQAGVVTGYQVRSMQQASDGSWEVRVVAQVNEGKLQTTLAPAPTSALDGNMLAIQMEQGRREDEARREWKRRKAAFITAIREGDPIAIKLLVPTIKNTEISDDYSGLTVRVEADDSRVSSSLNDRLWPYEGNFWNYDYGPYRLEIRGLDKHGAVVASVINTVVSPYVGKRATPQIGRNDPWWYDEGDFLSWWVKLPATSEQVAQINRIEARWVSSEER